MYTYAHLYLLEAQVCASHARACTPCVRTHARPLSCFPAWAQFHAAAEHEASFEYGPQVCRLAHATVLLTQAARSSSRPAPAEVRRAQDEALERIGAAAQKATHLNEAVTLYPRPNPNPIPSPQPSPSPLTPTRTQTATHLNETVCETGPRARRARSPGRPRSVLR